MARARSAARVLACAGTLLCLVPVSNGSAQEVELELARNLDFGEVWTGSTRTLQPNASTAASWTIRADAGTRLSFTFSLPASLMSGLNALPVSFAATSAAWDHNAATAGYTQFDPQQGTVVTVSRSNRLYLWLGGSISPPFSQPAGDYAGTITLTVTIN